MRDLLTAELIARHELPREAPPFSDRFLGLTPDDGYAGARALHAHRVVAGWHPVGRTIGFTNRTLWRRYGVDAEIWGTVYERTLIQARDDHATVALAGLVNPHIEPENPFAFYDPQEMRVAIDAGFGAWQGVVTEQPPTDTPELPCMRPRRLTCLRECSDTRRSR